MKDRPAILSAACILGWIALGGCGPQSPETPPVEQLDPRDEAGPPPKTLETLARTDHIALLQRCLDNYRKHYHGYTCTFLKQERIAGTVRKQQTIAVTFLDRPFSVGMKWIENPPKGDRVLYVEGKYDNEMLVRPSGAVARLLAPTVRRKPDGPDAMSSALRPVSLFGFQRGMESLLAVYRRAEIAGDLKQEFGDYAKIAGRRTLILVRKLPRREGYASHVTKTYIDLEYLVPIMIEGFGWDGEFVSRYLYKDVKFDVELTRDDFRPEAFDLKKEPG